MVTISKIEVLLKVNVAMAAEVLGVCVLTSVLDLILCKSLSAQNINQPISTDDGLQTFSRVRIVNVFNPQTSGVFIIWVFCLSVFSGEGASTVSGCR